jgi:hypothetical protein
MSLPELTCGTHARRFSVAGLTVLLLCLAVSSCRATAGPREPALTAEAFVSRYGLIKGSPDQPPATSGADPIPEASAAFDETMATTYRYGPSIAVIVELFRKRALEPRAEPRTRRDVQRAIDETFGVSLLGQGFHVRTRQQVSGDEAGIIELVDFDFGSGGLGQALIARPAIPNGMLMIALHGCLASPDDVLLEDGNYPRGFGRQALERWYTVVAPYVLSGCMWIHNLDWLGSLSGVSVFGYELAKIGALTRWARGAHEIRRTAIWGISLGGQYAMLSSALFPDLFDVTVISGATTDYEAAYLTDFDAVGVDGTAGRRLGANTQVALSARVARHDVIASILPRPIVFEMSTADLAFAPSAVAVINYVVRLAMRRRALRPEVVLFEGEHGTSPRATLERIDRAIGLNSRPNGRR